MATALPLESLRQPDLTREEREELERAANDEDGDEVVDGAAFLNKIGIPWPPPEPC
jgi:hypothetical protein